MTFIDIEYSRAGYIADFLFFAAFIVAAAWFLVGFSPSAGWPETLASALAGVFTWTLLEYLLHRFVLHRVEPFRSWHLEHHKRPRALLGTPTLHLAALILVSIFLPAFLAAGVWLATGFTLGVVTGILWYSSVHHAVHHWRAYTPWMKERRRVHAVHHARGDGNYGVSLSFWDAVFRTRCRRPM